MIRNKSGWSINVEKEDYKDGKWVIDGRITIPGDLWPGMTVEEVYNNFVDAGMTPIIIRNNTLPLVFITIGALLITVLFFYIIFML